MIAVADLTSGAMDARLPGVQILSISCSFWENLAKSYVGAPPSSESWRPHLGEILDPPLNRLVLPWGWCPLWEILDPPLLTINGKTRARHTQLMALVSVHSSVSY